MEVAKVFMNGGSQAVRLPRNCRFQEEEVLVKRIGNVVLLMPPDDPWSTMMEGLDLFTEDFLAEEIEDLALEEGPLL